MVQNKKGPMLTVSHSIKGEICILNLEGDLTSKNIDIVNQYMESDLEDLPFKGIIFNFKKINRTDSMGIGLMVSIHFEMKKYEKEFGLFNLPRSPKRIMERMHLGKVINIFDTEEEALTTLLNK